MEMVEEMKYNCHIRLRGRPWYQAARRVPLGYELDPAENRGFVLTIPAYLVIEEVVNRPPSDSWSDRSAFPFRPGGDIQRSDDCDPTEVVHQELAAMSI
jgi:hypothetical protein